MEGSPTGTRRVPMTAYDLDSRQVVLTSGNKVASLSQAGGTDK